MSSVKIKKKSSVNCTALYTYSHTVTVWFQANSCQKHLNFYFRIKITINAGASTTAKSTMFATPTTTNRATPSTMKRIVTTTNASTMKKTIVTNVSTQNCITASVSPQTCIFPFKIGKCNSLCTGNTGSR